MFDFFSNIIFDFILFAGLPHAAEPGAGGANAEQEAAGLASPRLRGVLASLASDAGLLIDLQSIPSIVTGWH